MRRPAHAAASRRTRGFVARSAASRRTRPGGLRPPRPPVRPPPEQVHPPGSCSPGVFCIFADAKIASTRGQERGCDWAAIGGRRQPSQLTTTYSPARTAHSQISPARASNFRVSGNAENTVPVPFQLLARWTAQVATLRTVECCSGFGGGAGGSPPRGACAAKRRRVQAGARGVQTGARNAPHWPAWRRMPLPPAPPPEQVHHTESWQPGSPPSRQSSRSRPRYFWHFR